jgi:molybdenum cofactor sulfurtransferase
MKSPSLGTAFLTLLLSACATLLRLLGLSPQSPSTRTPRTTKGRSVPATRSRFESHVAGLRSAEFSRLGDIVYCDHAGTTLYSERQLALVTRALATTLLGNPRASMRPLCRHTRPSDTSVSTPFADSGSDSSASSDAALDAARRATLAWCGTSEDEYVCVFTQSATAAVKLLAELFPWKAGSHFCYAVESHTSVLGMREYALEAGAAACAVSVQGTGEQDCSFAITPHGDVLRRGDVDGSGHDSAALSLFAFPGECNFTGARMDLRLCDALQTEGAVHMPINVPHTRWMVLLDAAKLCATHPPDLKRVKPHFVALSHYKIFGYPTGIGTLLVRRDALPVLLDRSRPAYWGGGTIHAASASADFAVRRSDASALEHGTADFTAAVAVPIGFDMLTRLPGGIVAADEHAVRVAAHFVARLRGLSHCNGQPAGMVYGWGSPVASTAVVGQGPTVAFNMLTASGAIIPPPSVEQALSLRHIQLRSGQFCNPGAAACALGFSFSDVQNAVERGHACGDGGGAHDDRDGPNLGALRASFGYISLHTDADAVMDALTEFFITTRTASSTAPDQVREARGDCVRACIRIANIWVYPLKGAAPWQPPSECWPLTANGFAYDRSWAAVDPGGAVLNQARCPKLASIHPEIDLGARTLTLTLANAASIAPLVLSLDDESAGPEGANTHWGLIVLDSQNLTHASSQSASESAAPFASRTRRPVMSRTNGCLLHWADHAAWSDACNRGPAASLKHPHTTAS